MAMFLIRIVIVLLLFVLNTSVFAQVNKVNIKAIPGWVEEVNPDLDALPDKSQTSGGYYYLLLDKQINKQKETQYIHRVVKVLDHEGIGEVSDISVEFDPAYMDLSFHSINVYRNGKIINKLADHSFSTIQRESDMERSLYDGHLTAYVNLRDIRQGDVLEYAYSIRGTNPIYEGKSSYQTFLELEIPVDRIYINILTAVDDELNFAYLNGADHPTVKTTNRLNQYTWDISNVKAQLPENNLPIWYFPLKYFLASDFHSWNEVVELILNEYQVSEKEYNELKSKSKDLFKSGEIEERMVEAIRFVQDEVRYLGFESGLSAVKPHHPVQVFEQRFGDCKDKTLLLHSLLHNMGVESYPMLVDYTKSDMIEKEVPTLGTFNHVILQIVLNNEVYYIDPTISSQGGTFRNIYFPDYRKGLVLKKGENSLTDLPKPNHSYIQVDETFILDEIGGNASLKIVSKYKGMYADMQRAGFTANSLEYYIQEYTHFYSQIYPEIEPTEELTYQDERELSNLFTTTETYYINNLWEEDPDNSSFIYVDFIPLVVNNEIPSIVSAKRTMPYALNYPVKVIQTTRIELPEVWEVSLTPYTIKTDEFQYEYNIRYEDKVITLDHSYETFTDHVKLENFRSFRKKIDKINEDISLQLSYNYDYEANTADNEISFLSVIIAFITLVVSGYFFYQIYNKYDPVAKNRVPGYTRSSIGGWLILFAIGLSFSPLLILFEVFGSGDYFYEYIWTTFSNPESSLYNPLLLVLVALELVFNLAIFCFVILLIVLFFQRRTSAPRLIVIYLGVGLVAGIVDTALTNELVGDLFTEEEKTAAIGDVIRLIVAAAIWIPYFLVSERVKDTFVKRLRPEPPDIPVMAKTNSVIGID